MQLLIYILVFPILWLISLLPFRILYLFSDVLAFILYYLIGYRKKVVLHNLTLSFPEKSPQELEKIRKKFYRHLTDVFMEIIKTITLSEKAIKKHFVFENVDQINEFGAKNKSIIMLGGHYANWEWIVHLEKHVVHRTTGVYTKIGNKYFDKMMIKNRGKFGGMLIQSNRTYLELDRNHKKGLLTLNGLVSDQSPQLSRAKYWRDFMGVHVPIHTGAENIAKKLDFAVFFYEIKKVKRGYYTCNFKLLSENPREHADYEITDKYLEVLEEQIRSQPEYYFWTHNRFKHKDKFETYLKNNPNYKFSKEIK